MTSNPPRQAFISIPTGAQVPLLARKIHARFIHMHGAQINFVR